MSPANTESERKALREIVGQLENPDETLEKQKRMQRVILGIGYVGLLIGFILAWHQTVSPVSSSLIIAISGAAVGLGVFLRWLGKMWPYTARYVDLDRVRQRLEELEHDGPGKPGTQ